MRIPTPNNSFTKLNGAINDTIDTIVVVDATKLPNSGYVAIGGGSDPLINEVIKYTGITENTLTGVTRGVDNTIAESHSDAAYIGVTIINKHFEEIWTEIQNNKSLEEVKCIFDINVTLSGIQSSDNVTTVENDRVLLINQTDAKENGLWLIKNTAWERPLDCVNGTSLGMRIVFVTNGTIGGGSGWFCNALSPNDIVGTNDLYFTQFSVGDSGVAMGNSDTIILDIESMFNTAKTSCYIEPTRNVEGRLTGWNVWETNAKTTQLFTQTRTFGTSGISLDRMITKVTSDIIRGKKIIETRTYVEFDTGSEILVLLGTKTKSLEDI